MMFRSFIVAATILSSISILAPSPAAHASTMGAPTVSATPLLILRFHQRDLEFQTPLRQALFEAQSVHPAAMYQLVAYAPMGKDQRAAQTLYQRTQQHVSHILQAAAAYGVDSSRIQVSIQQHPDVASPEAHLFIH